VCSGLDGHENEGPTVIRNVVTITPQQGVTFLENSMFNGIYSREILLLEFGNMLEVYHYGHFPSEKSFKSENRLVAYYLNFYNGHVLIIFMTNISYIHFMNTHKVFSQQNLYY
jgi:hypothetical protein